MSIAVKICGINTALALDAAIEAGASYVGLVFYPPSPRYVAPPAAAALAARVPKTIAKVGLFVNADDAAIAAAISVLSLDFLQLHGNETPERVSAVRRHFGLPVVKAIALGTKTDLARIDLYRGVADILLFDAHPPQRPDALPGGNAVSFDWTLLVGRTWDFPWILSGGLTPHNVAEAVRLTGAGIVDASSGVEDRPGSKNPAKIAAFIAAARRAVEG